MTQLEQDIKDLTMNELLDMEDETLSVVIYLHSVSDMDAKAKAKTRLEMIRAEIKQRVHKVEQAVGLA